MIINNGDLKECKGCKSSTPKFKCGNDGVQVDFDVGKIFACAKGKEFESCNCKDNVGTFVFKNRRRELLII